jgi:hypothetical protein
MTRKSIPVAVVAAILCSNAARAQTPPASKPYELDDQGLSAAIAGLDVPAQRYESFKKLVLYFASYPHSSPSIIMSYGSPELDARVKRAGQAIANVAKDVALVKQALADPNRILQGWGIGYAERLISDSRGNNPWAEVTDPTALDLLAKVREFLNSEDAELRWHAENALRFFPSERELLQTVLAKETSPDNIMFMVSGQRDPSEYSRLMNGHLLRLLGMNDPKVRADTMFFIDTNASMAEMYHCNFDQAVADKVLELAGNQPDRPAAAGALAALYVQKAGDSERIRATLQEMATDKNAMMRQHAVSALLGHRGSKELDSIFKGMANDSDDYVRLTVLSTLGYEGHEAELCQLAQSPNPEVAKRAAELLKFLQDRAAATREGK